jgi:hypothetical protein
MLNNVMSDGTQSGQYARLMPDTAAIFSKTDISHIVQSVFDAPMSANGRSQYSRRQKRGTDIKSRFFGGLPNTARPSPAAVPSDLDQAGRQRRPFRRPPRVGRVKNLGVAFFNPAIPFAGVGRHLLRRVMRGNQPAGFQKAGLIVLDLNQQVTVMR